MAPRGLHPISSSIRTISDDRRRLIAVSAKTTQLSLPEGFKYTVVKLHEASGTVSFVESSDFDTAPEPTVGEVVTVKPDGSTRRRKQLDDPYIYHHKWLFVSDDYRGFDVEESKRRSLQWLSLPGVDRKRIGKRSYWVENVLPSLRVKRMTGIVTDK